MSINYNPHNNPHFFLFSWCSKLAHIKILHLYSVMFFFVGFAPFVFRGFFCSITLVPCCKQDAFFGIFVLCTGFLIFTLSFRLVLWRNYNVVDPYSVLSYHSYSTLTFNVAIGLMVKSLSGFLPLRQLI